MVENLKLRPPRAPRNAQLQ